MLSSYKKAKIADSEDQSWQTLFEERLPNMMTFNNSAPFDPANAMLLSVEFCFYDAKEAVEMADEVAEFLNKEPYEILKKALPDGSCCDYFQLNLQDTLKLFGVAHSSIFVRLYHVIHYSHYKTLLMECIFMIYISRLLMKKLDKAF